MASLSKSSEANRFRDVSPKEKPGNDPLVEVFQSDELADLVEPALSADEAASRAAVDTDRITAVE